MTVPWIIWTAARTGGTTLYEALWQASSDLDYIEDEPFAINTEGWRELLEHSPRRYVIKHLLDPHEDEFNIDLAKAAVEAGYAAIHLVRVNEFARLVSRGIAMQLRAWHPTHSLPLIDEVLSGKRTLEPLDVYGLIAYSRQCRRQWEAVEPYLRDKLITVRYEDLYSDNRHFVEAQLWPFLDIDLNISDRLVTGGQDSRRIWHLIPNLDALRYGLYAG